jgi:purine-binding chemotaxis protein CheW
MRDTRQFCTFYVAGLYLGIDVLTLHEVLRSRDLARVPLAPANIEGLLNLRGRIVPAIDLRRRLGFPPVARSADSYFMLVRTAEDQVALIVDAVGDVIDVGADSFELPPETVQPDIRALIRGVHKLEGALLHILDAGTAAAPPPPASA